MKKTGVEGFLADLVPFFYKRRLTYVDVGAFIGEVFEKVLASGLRVGEAHLIEPNLKNLEAARERTRGLFEGHSVSYHNLALGRQPGRVRMRDAKDMTKVVSTGGALAQGVEPENTFDVACTTLDELAETFSERRISLLKIDVEGYELEVLGGGTSILQDQRVDVIYIEAGFNPQGTQQTYYRRIEDFLGGYGYKLFRVFEQHHEWIVDSPLLRRANLAFMSQRFADSNPYRLTLELHDVQRQVAALQGEAVRLREREKLLADANAERDDLRARLIELENSHRRQLTELNASRREIERAQEAARHLTAEAEKARRVSEQTLREIFESIAQIHRRELRAWNEVSSRDAEIRRIQATLRYRLGGVLAGRRSILGWMKAPVSLWREYARYRKDRASTPAPAAHDARSGAAFVLNTGAPSIALPLTRRPLTVLVPEAADLRELWCKLTSTRADAKVTVEIRFAGATPVTRLMTVGGKAVDVSKEPRPLVRRVEISSGKATRLLDVGGGSGEMTFEIARLKGDFGLLTLGQRNAIWVPGSTGQRDGSKSGPSEDDSKRRTLETAGSARFDAPRHADPSGVSDNFGHSRYSAEDLELKLWGGFARYAVAELEAIKADASATVQEREAAAWYLTRWFWVEENYPRVLENIEFAKVLPIRVRPRVSLAETLCLIAVGRYDEANDVLERAMLSSKMVDFWLLKSTVARRLCIQRGRFLQEAESEQLAALNEVFTRAGLSPIQKKHQDDPLALSNIVSHAEPRQLEQDEKVSVIVPAYNAAESIGWVLESILLQTWRNLEIIVVDDCSTDDTTDIVERIAARDSRVRLVRKPANEGAYPTRNAGARIATGNLIMVHDSDDWSHPQRIELQIEALRARPGIVAVKSHWVRVGPNIEILGAWVPRGTLFDLNFSSLLVRRETLDSLGMWDEVCVSGDAEFYSRLQVVYGTDAIVKLPKNYLLSLSLTRENSLTRSKATHLRSLFYGLRWNYRDSYLYWHARLQDQKLSLPFQGSNKRSFPVPLGNRPGVKVGAKYELVVISDFAVDDETFDEAISYVAAAGAKGKKVGVFHWRRFDLPSRAPLLPRFYDICLEGDADILSPGDSVEADVVVIGCAAALQYLIDPMPAINARKVVVPVLDVESELLEGRERRYDPLVVRSHLRRIFGVDGVWVPSTNYVRRQMIADGRYPKPHATPWLPLIKTAPVARAPIFWRQPQRNEPLVGRPAWDRRDAPDNWIACPANLEGKERFRELDFYVYFPDGESACTLYRELLLAMAAGLPTILPPRFEAIFADAAVYAPEAYIGDAIAEVWASKERYLQQAERGRAFVLEHCDITSLDDRLQQILEGSTPE